MKIYLYRKKRISKKVTSFWQLSSFVFVYFENNKCLDIREINDPNYKKLFKGSFVSFYPLSNSQVGKLKNFIKKN